MSEIKVAQKKAYELWGKHCSGGLLLYPNEVLTRFIFQNKNEIKSVLDFGTGDGRNAAMMAMAKISEIIGVDINESALNVARQRLGFAADLGVRAEFFKSGEEIDLGGILGKFWAERFGGEKFRGGLGGEKFGRGGENGGVEFWGRNGVDCVVCWGIFHLNRREIAQKMLLEFAKILKNGGVCFANWRTRRDSLYQNGREIDKDTFIIDAKSHENLLYFFPSLSEIKKMYKNAGLKITAIDREEFSQNNGKIVNSWHIIKAIRG